MPHICDINKNVMMNEMEVSQGLLLYKIITILIAFQSLLCHNQYGFSLPDCQEIFYVYEFLCPDLPSEILYISLYYGIVYND